MDEDEYFTIDQQYSAETKVKGSRFIGTACPVNTEDQAVEFIRLVSMKFYDATHNCYAYLIGYQPSIITRYSDAGEPGGTAGLPILNVIKGKQLTNIVIVITRYFGGTRLGKGGLVRAYSECTRKVIDQCSIIKQYIFQKLRLKFDYNLTGPVMRVVSLFNANILESIYKQQVSLVLTLRKSQIENFKSNLLEISSGKVSIHEES
ncbi:MAG: YigZ family protein [bacterium]|nr:MAG: YigZ family protein [bacterium]